MKESGIDWIKQIPEEWGVSRLKYYFDIYAGGDIDERNTVEEYSESHPYPVLSNSLENEGVLGYTNKYRFKNNCVTVTGRGDVGKAVYRNIKFYPVVRLLVCVPKSQVDCRFVTYWINSAIIEKNQTAVSQLTIQMLGELIFVNVPFLEQKNIADFLDKKTAQLDKVKSLLEEQIQKLKDYRASLIYETVTKGLDKTVPLKDSGIDWIGQVPEGWGVSKIKFTTQLNGRIGWQGLTSAEYKEEGPYLITGTDFHNGTINFETAVHIDEKRWSEASQIQVENGDLLITKDGTVGKVAIISGLDDKASLNSGVLRIQTIDEIDRRFLYYVLLSDEFWMWFNYTNSGASTILHLYQNVFDEFTFTFPQKNEQTKISDLLDKKTYQIDQLIQIKNQQIENINKQRQTLIYDYVTGKRRV